MHMIGIIVTGHGTFASGMAEAVRLLAGMPEYFKAVDFTQADSTDDLEFRLKDVILSMDACDGIVIFTDVVNGAPYQEAVELSRELADKQDIRIVSGTNLAMLVQADTARGYVQDPDGLADLAAEEGRKNIVKFVDSDE